VYAAIDLKAGEILSMDNLVVLRPEGGISPMRIDELIGRELNCDISAQTAISWDHLKA
jgi:N-acetylneuraminate synthase/N,N'-diacetyllegionaminate synthase